MIIQNKIRCLVCGGEPCSSSRHHRAMCECGAVGVDGGMDYLKRHGDREDMKELSILLPEGAVKKLIDMIKAPDEWGGSIFVLGEIARTLQEYGREK